MANSEEVKLLGMWASPLTRRVELALKLKGIPYEYIEEDLSHKSPLLLKYNPIHKKVPVLVHNQKPIVDSSVILEYTDETWKNNPILPQDPHDRALARFWAKFIDEKLLVTARKMRSDQEVVDEVIEQLKMLENELRGKEFFGVEKNGYLDIAAHVIAFWFIVGQEFPMIYKWIGKLKDTDAAKESQPALDKYHQFMTEQLEASKRASK